VKGICLAKQGQHQRAQALLKEENLAICLIEMGSLKSAFNIAKEINSAQILEYITTKIDLSDQHDELSHDSDEQKEMK
jgi:hypothetical protein